MDESKALSLRDIAKRDLQEIKTVEEAVNYMSQLKAAQTWALAVKKDTELFNMISEQRLRTQRLLGKILETTKKNKGVLMEGKTPRLPDMTTEKLSDIGITKNQSSDFQRMASIPDDQWESFLEEKKTAVEKAVKDFSVAGAVRLAKGITYEEHNRLATYLNRFYANEMRAYAYDEGIDISDAVGRGCKMLIESLSEEKRTRMRHVYFRDHPLVLKSK